MIRSIICFFLIIIKIAINHSIREIFAYTTAVPQQRKVQYESSTMIFPNHVGRIQHSALSVVRNIDEVQGYGTGTGSTRSMDPQPYRRRPIVAGNWKLNPTTYNEAITLLQLLYANFIHHRNTNSVRDESDYSNSNTGNIHSDIEVVIFPPYPFLSIALQLLDGSGIKVGVQNIGLYTSGAYTGEVSITQIQSMGIDYVLLGHSERRSIFDETDQQINEKILLCIKEPAISVILCVGETEEEYDSELLSSVCNVQVRKALRNVSAADVLDRITIAYEPIWAIGTGKVATPEQAQEAHSVIRNTLIDMYGYEIAYQVRIQYGGSVKPDNIVDIMRMPDVDGALVGGASLSSDSFTRIVDGAIATKASSSSSYLYNHEHVRSRELTAREAVRTKNVLGESVVWSTRDQALYWISAPQQEVWTWNLKDPAYRRLLGTDLGCVAMLNDETTTASPESKLGSIVVAGERAFLRLTMSKSSNDYSTGPTILCDRPEQTDVTRPNDGRVDRQGRLVFGMYNNYHRAPVDGYDGANICELYRLNELCQIESLLPDDGVLPKYRVSNCICFSPDIGDTMYFCDTPTRKIYAFDYPHGSDGKGNLSNRRLIWTMPSQLPGGPDGAQVGT
jgi:triosephosphate isomerase (TIM)